MKIERLLSMIILLLENKIISATTLAEYFEVTKRTIYRDIETLELAGFPIISYAGKKGGFGLLESFKMNKFTFSDIEKQRIIEALRLQEQLLSFQETDSIIKGKLYAIQEFDAKNIEFTVSSATLHNPLVEAQVNQKLSLLYKALINNQKVKLAYITIQSKITDRVILPIELLLQNGSWYLKAYCELRKDIRLFKITRILNLEVLDITFIRTSIQESKTRISKRIEIQLSFSKEVLGKLYDFFLEQQINTINDRIIVTFLCYLEESILPFLLMFKNQVQVVYPSWLKEKHIEEIKNMQHIY